MKQVIEASGKTVEAAIANGAEQLGVDRDLVTYEIIEMPKKGFLGFGEIPAKVKVMYDSENENTALSFVRTLIADMGINAQAEMSDIPDSGRSKLIKISGEESGILIGHHGATLDALQYLVNLAANNKEDAETSEGEESEADESSDAEAYAEENSNDAFEIRDQITERAKTSAHGSVRITVDIENYRAKREQTLRELARKMASKALKYHKSITLEPMNPYERRIIHSEIQEIEGVMTTSIGTDNERRIVIYLEDGSDRRSDRRGRGHGNNRNGNRGGNRPNQPRQNVAPKAEEADSVASTGAATVFDK